MDGCWTVLRRTFVSLHLGRVCLKVCGADNPEFFGDH
jgi:hypothetical protein